MTQRRSHAVEKRHDGNEQGQRHHKRGGKDLRMIISATSCKICWVCASMIIVPLKKTGYKDVKLI